MKRIFLFVLSGFFLIGFVSCNRGHLPNGLEFKVLKPTLDAYLAQNEKFVKLTIVNSDEKFPEPSFHLYLYKWNEDTVVSIVQRPFLVESHILGKQISDSVDLYNIINPRGFIEYKNSPIILFDPDNLFDQSFVKSLRNVPDNYKFQGQNIHKKSEIWDFTLKNGEFVRDDREMHLTAMGN